MARCEIKKQIKTTKLAATCHVNESSCQENLSISNGFRMGMCTFRDSASVYRLLARISRFEMQKNNNNEKTKAHLNLLVNSALNQYYWGNANGRLGYWINSIDFNWYTVNSINPFLNIETATSWSPTLKSQTIVSGQTMNPSRALNRSA